MLLAVYTKLDTLKTPEAFWGWLNQTTANRCVKLYSLSPLPFMLFFLLRATSQSADGVQAAAAARQVMEAGAAAGVAAGGVSAGTTTAAATAGSAAGSSAAAAGGLSAKLIAGILVGVLLVGGGAAAAVIAIRNAREPEPVVSEVEPEEDEEDETGLAETEPEETPPAEDEPIPAARLALLGGIAYYGDPAEYRMTVNQARAYAKVIETGSDAPYAALIDVGKAILSCCWPAGPMKANLSIPIIPTSALARSGFPASWRSGST